MLRSLIKRVLLGSKASSATYIAKLKQIGISVGEDVSIYAPNKTLIDECYPWMITIGDHVRIAEGVKILAHDYSWAVLKRISKGAILGASGKVTIGNNVFIGMNAIILRGVTIEDNVIIGSGSVVTKDCLSNGVYAGNPAKRIAELDVFLEKRKAAQVNEARELAVQYYKRYGKRPPQEIFHEYFPLFMDKDSMLKEAWSTNKLHLCGNYKESLAYMEMHERPFENYEAFMRYCFDEQQ